MESFENPFDGYGNYIYNKEMFIMYQYCIFDLREDFDMMLY